MSSISYEASVHTRTVRYKNFKGKEQEFELYFALDPMSLLQLIAATNIKAEKKSGNPAKLNTASGFTEEKQINLVKDLAVRAAGFPSDDGESFEPFEGFSDSLAGKTFLTHLVTSDVERDIFADKVILDPFRAFVSFALAEDSNSEADKAHFRDMLKQVESIFAPKDKNESLEDRKARLARELAALENSGNE